LPIPTREEDTRKKSRSERFREFIREKAGDVERGIHERNEERRQLKHVYREEYRQAKRGATVQKARRDAVRDVNRGGLVTRMLAPAPATRRKSRGGGGVGFAEGLLGGMNRTFGLQGFGPPPRRKAHKRRKGSRKGKRKVVIYV